MARLNVLSGFPLWGILSRLSWFFVFSFGALAGYRLFGQVRHWVNEAVWSPDPVLSEFGRANTGLKGIDVILMWFLDNASVGSVATFIAVIFWFFADYFKNKQDRADTERARLRVEQKRAGV